MLIALTVFNTFLVLITTSIAVFNRKWILDNIKQASKPIKEESFVEHSNKLSEEIAKINKEQVRSHNQRYAEFNVDTDFFESL